MGPQYWVISICDSLFALPHTPGGQRMFSLRDPPPQVGPDFGVSLEKDPDDCISGFLLEADFDIHPVFLIGESSYLFLCCHSAHTHVDVIQDRVGIDVSVNLC